MLARLYRRHRDYRVRMVRSRHNHRLDVLLLLKHHTVVTVFLRVRILFERLSCIFVIHIAKRHYVFTFHLAYVIGALTSDADARDIELLARWCMVGPTENVTRYNCKRHGGRRSAAHKFPPRNLTVFAFGVFLLLFHISTSQIIN